MRRMFGEICSPSPREGLLTVPSGCPPARGAVGDAGAALPIPVPHPSQPKATGRDEDNHGVKTPGQAAAGTWSPGWAHRGDLPGSGSAPGKPKPPPPPAARPALATDRRTRPAHPGKLLPPELEGSQSLTFI